MLDLARSVPPHSRLGRWLRWPLNRLPRDLVVRVLVGSLRGMRWQVGVGLHGCWLGTYEWQKQKLIASRVRPGDVVYDIGANVGFYSLLASRRVGVTGRVHAFEPLARNADLLRQMLALNRCTNTAVHDLAVANHRGVERFMDSGSYTGRLDGAGSVEVRVETLDHLVEAGVVAPAKVVKIDVEGSEAAVLEGGAGFFRRCRPVIFLATHGAQLHAASCERLRGWGYRLFAVNPDESVEATEELLAEPCELPGQ